MWYASPYLLVLDFTSDFRFYDYYHISCSYPALFLVFYSTSLLFSSYPEYFLSDIYLLTCFCSRHGFQCMIMIRFYRYTCTYLSTPSGFCITTHLGSSIWLPWILMSRSWSLERVDSPSCWSEWRSWSVDPQQTIWSSTLPGPLCASRVFLFVNSWVPFILFTLVHLFVFSHLRLSVM